MAFSRAASDAKRAGSATPRIAAAANATAARTTPGFAFSNIARVTIETTRLSYAGAPARSTAGSRRLHKWDGGTMYPRARIDALILLIVSSVRAVAGSFVSPRQALWAFALNLAAPWLARRGRNATRERGIKRRPQFYLIGSRLLDRPLSWTMTTDRPYLRPKVGAVTSPARRAARRRCGPGSLRRDRRAWEGSGPRPPGDRSPAGRCRRRDNADRRP